VASVSNPVWRALEDRVRRRPADPIVTYLDAEGQRTELSAKTFANNAAKAANALRDEALLDPGARVAMHVPWHWQRSVWTIAAWLIDATVVPGGAPDESELVVAGPEEAAALTGGSFGPRGSAELWVVSMHPFGLPNSSVPEGSLDAATIARIQPDAFAPGAPMTAPGGTPALILHDGTSRAQQDLLDRAASIGAGHALQAGERFAMVGEPADELEAWLLASLVPLACDASIVMAGQSLNGDPIEVRESARLIG
jgi:uncharacterized protein (TIGR03089 family)